MNQASLRGLARQLGLVRLLLGVMPPRLWLSLSPRGKRTSVEENQQLRPHALRHQKRQFCKK